MFGERCNGAYLGVWRILDISTVLTDLQEFEDCRLLEDGRLRMATARMAAAITMAIAMR